MEIGQLTEIGCQQMHSVGTRLRKRYVDELGYLPSDYDPRNSPMHYNCTNMRRTIHSADNLLCGLCMFSLFSYFVFLSIFRLLFDFCFLSILCCVFFHFHVVRSDGKTDG